MRITTSLLTVLCGLLEACPGEVAGSDLINRYRVFSGTLYPVLDRLEKLGWIKGRWEDIDPHEEGRPRRKLYRLTAEGQLNAASLVVQNEHRLPKIAAAQIGLKGGANSYAC